MASRPVRSGKKMAQGPLADEHELGMTMLCIGSIKKSGTRPVRIGHS